jgi:hypothetical protein
VDEYNNTGEVTVNTCCGTEAGSNVQLVTELNP